MPLWLYIQAPFAAFRWMQAGVYRATSPIIPPTTAWGLILNLAGIETRDSKNSPRLKLAIGSVTKSEIGVLYQQLHNYPVGSVSKKFKEGCHGAKYHIAPIKREFLINFKCIIGVEADTELLNRIKCGIAGELDIPRYGLPFAGDNNFLIDKIECVDNPPLTKWFVLINTEQSQRESCRLTVNIDRENSSKTIAKLFAPISEPCVIPPSTAWVWPFTEA